MDTEEFARVTDSFERFHDYFAPAFGRKEVRRRSGHYLRGLFVQSSERRNAENMAEAVDDSARSMQRFLTEALWDDEDVTELLQTYLGEKLAQEEGVWILDDSGIPKQGEKSVGVARQYCNALGKISGCQVGVFLGHVSSIGRAIVDKRLYLPREWIDDPKRCDAAGVPKQSQVYKKKTELALDMLLRAREFGHMSAGWVTGDDAYGMSPDFRDALRDDRFLYVLEMPGDTPAWPQDPTWEVPEYSGYGRPATAKPVREERRSLRARAEALPKGAWTKITVGEGSKGPMTYWFFCERVRETRDGKPGELLWALYRKNLDESEPRYYYSNAPIDTSLPTMARVCASRWPIETEFEVEKSLAGLDEYEVRSWQGWHRHMTMCMLACAFLLSLQQEWKKKHAPDNPSTGTPDSSRVAA